MAEARARCAVVIGRPVAEVFAFMADYRNNPRWQEGLLAVEQADVPPRVGSLISTTRRLLGRTSTSVVRVTAYEEGRRIRSRSESGPVDYEGGYDYEAAGEGATRVAYEGVIRTGRLMGPVGRVLARGFQGQMDQSLARLARLLEAAGAQ